MIVSGQSAHQTGRLKIEHVFVPENIDIRPVGHVAVGAGSSDADHDGLAHASEPRAQVARPSLLPLSLDGVVTGRTISLMFLAVGLFLIVMVLWRLPYPSTETAADVSTSEQAPLSSLPARHSDEPGRTADDVLIDAITSRAVSRLRGGSPALATQSE